MFQFVQLGFQQDFQSLVRQYLRQLVIAVGGISRLTLAKGRLQVLQPDPELAPRKIADVVMRRAQAVVTVKLRPAVDIVLQVLQFLVQVFPLNIRAAMRTVHFDVIHLAMIDQLRHKLRLGLLEEIDLFFLAGKLIIHYKGFQPRIGIRQRESRGKGTFQGVFLGRLNLSYLRRRFFHQFRQKAVHKLLLTDIRMSVTEMLL